jgi:iron(III) transport system ATP-binding protein
MVNSFAPRRRHPSEPLGAQSVVIRGVTKSFGATEVLRDVSVRVAEGRMLALLGPSGCGKTTLLRIVAGLEVPDRGEVLVGGKVLTGGGHWVPPERRHVGLVFQDWALFPHLDVGANVAYGLPRLRRDERARRVGEALDMVGLSGLDERAPGTLSGGQQQRVALARAIAPRPDVLLLDEPFSNLDTALRVQVRTEVHQLLVELGITTVFVTHDQEEAFVLGDEVAVMHQGQVVQQDTPAELYRAPANRFVASFVGDANLIAGEAEGTLAHTAMGMVPLAASSHGPVEVLVRPEECKLRPGADARIELIEFYGHDTVYVVALADGGSMRVRQGAAPTFGRGEQVSIEYVGGPTSAYLTGPTA